MAAPWTSTDYTILAYGGNSYYFAPTELLYLGQRKEKNQVVAESESGQVKISILDTSERIFWEFSVFMMQAADRTVGATTVSGYDRLRTFLTTTVNYRENIVSIKPPGTLIGDSVNGRYWMSEFPDGPKKLLGTTYYYGDGSDVLLFRKEL